MSVRSVIVHVAGVCGAAGALVGGGDARPTSIAGRDRRDPVVPHADAMFVLACLRKH